MAWHCLHEHENHNWRKGQIGSERQDSYQGMMSTKADRVRLSHGGRFRSDCRLVPSSEKWSGWKDMACDTEVREKGDNAEDG